MGSSIFGVRPKGLKVVSNLKVCAESKNQRLGYRICEIFYIIRHCFHGDNSTKFFLGARVLNVMCNQDIKITVFLFNNIYVLVFHVTFHSNSFCYHGDKHIVLPS